MVSPYESFCEGCDAEDDSDYDVPHHSGGVLDISQHYVQVLQEFMTIILPFVNGASLTSDSILKLRR